MRKIITLLFTVASLSSWSLLSFAQHSGRVSGSVRGENQKALESATISVLKAKDSSVAKVNAADKNGNYVFESIPEGSFLISVTAVDHEKAFSEIFEINEGNTSVSLKPIQLMVQAKSLTGVSVTAKRPLIEQKIDRTVVNVEAAVTNVGTSALEVLEKSPGITVDKDGNISLKGKQGVIVLVDGRQTQLGGADLANLLRSMHASQLDQIEIMTNPPAKYDAAGNAGVINIKTKKTRQLGYNGTVTLGYGQGKYPKFNEGLNFNYSTGKVNVFTNLSHNYRKNFNKLTIQRNFIDRNTKNITSHFDQTANMLNVGNSFNGKIGMDYFASKKTTIGVVFTGFANPRTFSNRNHTLITNVIKTSQTKATADYDAIWKNFGTNLNFRRLLDSAGKELTADVDYVTYDSRNDQRLSNYYFDATGIPIEKADTLLGALPQNIKIYSAKIDYLQPLKKGARFEAGVKSSIIRTDNNARYDSITYGQVVHDFNRSNYFIYEENINAAYVNLSGSLSKKWNGQLGLRLENTVSNGNQVTTGEKFNRPYTQLFPTAFLQYMHNEKNQFVLNYGRRLRRPNYQSLNPFIEFIDRYTYQQGNPNLRPQFSHNVELRHTYKNFLTTTLNYTNTTDIIQQVIEQNEAKNETFVKQANIANQRQYGISVNVSAPITKWWTNNLFVNVFNNKFSGIVSDTFVSVGATSLTLNGSQQFKLSKTWSGELSGFYRTAAVEGVIKAKALGQVSAGVSKQIMKNNGTLRLNVRDIFYTQRFRGVSKYSNIDAAFQERSDSRVVNVGFTYRFSKGKVNTQKRKNGSTADEQNRVGVQ
ncbi:MAG: TonB-dependent receptor domain-containing protein [Chitinophagaceae bacterium]